MKIPVDLDEIGAACSAMSIARMRRLMRLSRVMSIAPDISSANTASPSWVAVTRGEVRASEASSGCARPFSAVSECT